MCLLASSRNEMRQTNAPFYCAQPQEVARLAEEINTNLDNIGARRLHTVLERLLDEISFDAPDRVRIGCSEIDPYYKTARMRICSTSNRGLPSGRPSCSRVLHAQTVTHCAALGSPHRSTQLLFSRALLDLGTRCFDVHGACQMLIRLCATIAGAGAQRGGRRGGIHVPSGQAVRARPAAGADQEARPHAVHIVRTRLEATPKNKQNLLQYGFPVRSIVY